MEGRPPYRGLVDFEDALKSADYTYESLTLTRAWLGRIVDELDGLDRMAWDEQELDREELRRRVSRTMELATTTFDALGPFLAALRTWRADRGWE